MAGIIGCSIPGAVRILEFLVATGDISKTGSDVKIILSLCDGDVPSKMFTYLKSHIRGRSTVFGPAPFLKEQV